MDELVVERAAVLHSYEQDHSFVPFDVRLPDADVVLKLAHDVDWERKYMNYCRENISIGGSKINKKLLEFQLAISRLFVSYLMLLMPLILLNQTLKCSLVWNGQTFYLFSHYVFI